MKKRKAIKYCFGFITGVMISTQFVYAQQKTDSSEDTGLKSLIKFTISWHNGVEWEKKIGKRSTIGMFGGMVIGLAADGFSFADYFNAPLQISPDVYVEYRNYYNLFRRINNQKKVNNNSANFLFSRVEIILPVKNQNDVNLLFIQGWGAQRSLSKKISVNCHLGLIEHFYYDAPPNGGFNYIKFEPIAQCAISYVF